LTLEPYGPKVIPLALREGEFVEKASGSAVTGSSPSDSKAGPLVPRHVAALGFIAIIGVIVGYALWTAQDFSQDARTAPLVIGIPTVAAIAAQVIRDTRRVKGGDTTVGSMSEQESDRHSGDDEKPGIEEQQDGTLIAAGAEIETDDRRTTLLMAGVWVLALAVMTFVLGMLISIPLFIGLFMRVFGKERWLVVVLYATGATAFVYTLFVYLLDVRLYPGIVGGMLPWP
jgi:hypothetical protein